MTRLLVLMTATLALSACDKEETAEPQTPAEAAAPEANAAEPERKGIKKVDLKKLVEEQRAAKGESEEEPPAEPAWELDLGDSRKGVGKSVMRNKIGKAVFYKLVGASFTGTIVIEGTDVDQVGDFRAKSIDVLHMKPKTKCGASGEEVAVKIEKAGDGIRGTIDGTVECAQLEGGDAKETVAIKGWFES